MALVVFATWDDVPHATAAGWALAVLLATAFRSVWLRTVHQRCAHGPRYLAGRAPHRRPARHLLGRRHGDCRAGLAVRGFGAATRGPLLDDRRGAHDAFRRLGEFPGVRQLRFAPRSPSACSSTGKTACTSVTAERRGVVRRPDGVHLPARARGIVDHLRATALLAVSEETARRAEIAMREARDVAEKATRAAARLPREHEPRDPDPHERHHGVRGAHPRHGSRDRAAARLELVRASSEALLTILNDVLDYSEDRGGAPRSRSNFLRSRQAGTRDRQPARGARASAISSSLPTCRATCPAPCAAIPRASGRFSRT